jgi:hypothetical protein
MHKRYHRLRGCPKGWDSGQQGRHRQNPIHTDRSSQLSGVAMPDFGPPGDVNVAEGRHQIVDLVRQMHVKRVDW